MDLRVVAILLVLGARGGGPGARAAGTEPTRPASLGTRPGPEPRLVRQPKQVLLRIHPRVGDTLRMRFDQLVHAAGPVPTKAGAAEQTTAMHVHSRSVVERVDATGATVLTITDSAMFDAPGTDPRRIDAARRAMRGRWMRMRVSPAGAMEVLEVAPQGSVLGAQDALARLPGTLPETAVTVGSTWTRELALPWSGNPVVTPGGHLQVIFRLDSVARGGTLAYVSMRGALARAAVAQGGGQLTTSGTMTGDLLVDLRRGWMTDSHATFTLVSTLLPKSGGATAAQPMELRVTITQRLHCNE